jgi:hypothetical protein
MSLIKELKRRNAVASPFSGRTVLALRIAPRSSVRNEKTEYQGADLSKVVSSFNSSQ